MNTSFQTTRHVFTATALFLICVSTSIVHAQGPLTPPGPPAPTMKSLSDLDADLSKGGEKRIDILTLPGDANNQYIISAQGSYYLSGPINGVSGKNGINIQNGNVKVDLNGYQMLGVPGSLNGVTVGVYHLDIEVRNGGVSGWGGNGIDVSNGGGMVVSDILCTMNAGIGIYTGDSSSVTRCTARGNSGINIRVGFYSVITQCVATVGSSDGISTLPSCVVTDCTAGQNAGNGLTTGDNCTVSRVSAIINTANGMSLGQNCSLTDCVASQNTQNGVVTGVNCNLYQVTANQNSGSGFNLGGQTKATECVSNNNGFDGYFATNRNLLHHCTAVANGTNGIRAEFAPIVLDSYCELNGACGILVDAGGAGTIRENTCLENGRNSTAKGAGIRITTAGQCRLERNVTSFNYYGIDLQIPANVIVGTTATANTTNYNFVAGNHYGPIVDDTAIDAVSAPPVAGLSAAGDINSTSPWANFSH